MEKLDKLVNLVGELVTTQARLSQASAILADPGILLISEETERLTALLRESAMSIRMVPFGTIFPKFRRLVHDLSSLTGKEVEFITEGGETELDKNVIDRLNEPIVHIIRNSMDHGIELPDARLAKGKPKKGTLHISAVHSGPCVHIEIMDDGKGLDPEVIKAKAVEKGLFAPDAELTEKDILSLIFAPGFSTASGVTNVSGRGVGLDIVKKNLEAFHGTVEVVSRKDAGTAITLKIPLTLAIIEGLLVEVSDEFFILPLHAVEECIDFEMKGAESSHGRRFANMRDRLVPYISLREYFDIKGQAPSSGHVVITTVDGKKVGFLVDRVLGGHQTVVKPLGRLYRDIEGISGATILGDGTLALIIDASKMLILAEKEVMSMSVI